MNADYLQSLCYLDTNLLIYMFDDKDVVKQQKANELYLYFLTTGLGRISVQVMSEWRNAMVKKFAHLMIMPTVGNFSKRCKPGIPCKFHRKLF